MPSASTPAAIEYSHNSRRNLGNLRQSGTQNHDDAIAWRGRLGQRRIFQRLSSAAATAAAGSASGFLAAVPHCSNGTSAANCRATDESVP